MQSLASWRKCDHWTTMRDGRTSKRIGLLSVHQKEPQHESAHYLKLLLRIHSWLLGRKWNIAEPIVSVMMRIEEPSPAIRLWVEQQTHPTVMIGWRTPTLDSRDGNNVFYTDHVFSGRSVYWKSQKPAVSPSTISAKELVGDMVRSGSFNEWKNLIVSSSFL